MGWGTSRSLSQIIKRTIGVILIAGILVCFGCGGGTDGTGFKRVDGSVRSAKTTEPIPNVEVTNNETGVKGNN